MDTRETLLRYMQEAGEAGRRDMAAAVGVSHVMIGRMVRQLEAEGVLRDIGTAPSGGGRPERRYRYNSDHACVLLFRLEGEEKRGTLELLDMQGRLLEQKSARFTRLHAEMLDDWMYELTHRWLRKVQRITLYLPDNPATEELREHLREMRQVPTLRINAAEALADRHSRTVTLLCMRGFTPHAAQRGEKELHPCPYLHHLPLPDRWESLDYSDHTLVEEMLCRLLHLLICTGNPERVVLYCNYLTERLLPRIRYNLSTKLKGMEQPPRLHFRSITPEQLNHALRSAATRESVRNG